MSALTGAYPETEQMPRQYGATDEPRAWLVVAFIVGVVAFLKGVRSPIRWAATQGLVDYRFGVIKRGLFGALIARPLHLERYLRFAWFSFGTLALLFLLLAPLCLHLLGWDAGRWNALTVLSAFLVLLIVCTFEPPAAVRLRLTSAMRLTLFTVCMLNMASGELLLGDAPVRPFPFVFANHSLRVLLPGNWSPAEPTPDKP